MLWLWLWLCLQRLFSPIYSYWQSKAVMWTAGPTPPTPHIIFSELRFRSHNRPHNRPHNRSHNRSHNRHPQYCSLSEGRNSVRKHPQQILAFCISGSLPNRRGPPRAAGSDEGLIYVTVSKYVRDARRHKWRAASAGPATVVWLQYQPQYRSCYSCLTAV